MATEAVYLTLGSNREIIFGPKEEIIWTTVLYTIILCGDSISMPCS
jgi:hypothetical protein